MRKIGAVLTMVGGLAATVASPAMADGFESYRFCGGNNFGTCAAVEISVVGQTVTMRVWNLSQNSGATNGLAATTYSNSIIDGIALFNLPAGLQANPGSLTVSGPGSTPPASGWTLKNYDTVGAIALDGRNGPGHSLTGGIASGCGGQAASTVSLLVTPCASSFAPGSWVTFTFQISGSWDPNLSDIGIRAHDPVSGQINDMWTGTSPNGERGFTTTVTPEPVTMVLLGTGLAGMGGAGLVRRRRKDDT